MIPQRNSVGIDFVAIYARYILSHSVATYHMILAVVFVKGRIRTNHAVPSTTFLHHVLENVRHILPLLIRMSHTWNGSYGSV